MLDYAETSTSTTARASNALDQASQATSAAQPAAHSWSTSLGGLDVVTVPSNNQMAGRSAHIMHQLDHITKRLGPAHLGTVDPVMAVYSEPSLAACTYMLGKWLFGESQNTASFVIAAAGF